MNVYNLKIKNIEALYKYIVFLKTFEFEGEILTRSESVDAKDILFICDKLLAKEFCLSIRHL